jgi:vancomycin permeability regulator SanA
MRIITDNYHTKRGILYTAKIMLVKICYYAIGEPEKLHNGKYRYRK